MKINSINYGIFVLYNMMHLLNISYGGNGEIMKNMFDI